jgi:prophage regulatory protein
MTQIRFLKLREVLIISGKSKSSIYDAIKRNEFPAPLKLSNRSSGWIQSEVVAWAEERVKASRPGKNCVLRREQNEPLDDGRLSDA